MWTGNHLDRSSLTFPSAKQPFARPLYSLTLHLLALPSPSCLLKDHPTNCYNERVSFRITHTYLITAGQLKWATVEGEGRGKAEVCMAWREETRVPHERRVWDVRGWCHVWKCETLSESIVVECGIMLNMCFVPIYWNLIGIFFSMLTRGAV